MIANKRHRTIQEIEKVFGEKAKNQVPIPPYCPFASDRSGI